jgi:hypothetical protein
MVPDTTFQRFVWHKGHVVLGALVFKASITSFCNSSLVITSEVNTSIKNYQLEQLVFQSIT